MTPEEQQLANRLSSIESRLNDEFGNDPSVLHPHGNRTKAGRNNDLAQENMNRLFSLSDKLDDRLKDIESWKKGLRGENGIVVNKNVIGFTGNPNDNQTSSTTTVTTYVAAQVVINGAIYNVNLSTDGAPPVPV